MSNYKSIANIFLRVMIKNINNLNKIEKNKETINKYINGTVKYRIS